MFTNHFKITLRTLLKNKSQSAILIGGLTIGMAACILLLQYVNFELSFDKFHAKHDRIYRVVNERFQNGESVQKGTITYPTISRAMMEDFPEIKNATRIAYSSDAMITHEGSVEPAEPSLWVDEHFFEIFDFKLLAQSDLKLLDETNEIILTQDLADKYFPLAKGDYDRVLGQELTIDRYDEIYKIVGVCENVPSNSTLDFQILGSYASAIRYWGEGADNSWTWSDFYHYIELEPEADAVALQAKFADFSERHFRGAEVSGSEEVFTLQPMQDAHLKSSNLEYEIGRTANGRAVWSLLIIAFFILVIAWVNYVNLSSVRAIERAKEVGVRKVVGATRGMLVRQFLTEAFVVNAISLVLAVALAQLALPGFAQMFALDASALSIFGGPQTNAYLLLTLVALVIGGVFISGAYPAWLLSSPHVSSVLKGIFTKDLGGGNMRKGLVVFQFTLSIAFIAGTWLVSRQIDYMANQDMGINIERVLNVNSPELTEWDTTFIDRMNTMKAELVKFPNIQKVATSNRAPGERMGRIFQMRKMGEGETDENYTTNFIQVDFDYAETYGLEPVAGRFFRRDDHSNNIDEIENIVMNEACAKMLGYPSAEAVVGTQLDIYEKVWNVIGVLPDFHQMSMHHQIEPMLFSPFYGTSNLLSVKISGENIDQTINQIKTTYAAFFPGNTFHYEFVDDSFQRLYESDKRFSSILSFFTLLTILIACLGLFGLASYTTILRTKEIGVRKVLGASSASIVALLSKDFLKLVGIALVIAAPLAWYALNLYLQEFAYRVNIDWWVFAVAGFLAVLIAFFTISFQSVKAAMANPVDSLRSE